MVWDPPPWGVQSQCTQGVQPRTPGGLPSQKKELGGTAARLRHFNIVVEAQREGLLTFWCGISEMGNNAGS